ncbi:MULTISPECIES: arylamine N-acetyltransferase family protein [unclassified Streptomyces]|uniref:arylamine N-acetyltransferase family protein n=1 Tax=unclassified Streptomyces TaxID=2593676 RepID=UPI002E2FC5F5|nr:MULTISPECIES: arylamine N-acetyltransferase [unclassified Streptomyces]WUC65925.1 arylamine N-acetyltransferase [Streptomyces sp. NBC_00539]
MTSGTSAMYADYLRRLRVADPGTPSTEGLFALHRAHVERVPFENLGIQLGRPPGIDPELSVRRLAAGTGGYCFHLNGAFSALLETLGYDVTRHYGGVAKDPASQEISGDHLTLTVRVEGAEYLVDVGLGDGPHEPLPLREGTYEQGGFPYALERLERLERLEPRVAEGEGGSGAGGWSLHNSARPAPRMNFRSAPAVMADFAPMHAWLSADEDSPFVRTLVLYRRDAGGIDALQGRVLSRIDPLGGTSKRELSDSGEFYEAVATVFGRDLGDLTPADRTALWSRVLRAHEAWAAARPA